jgi:outer membrane protein OmpA-like peptidoglycan-associated protein
MRRDAVVGALLVCALPALCQTGNQTVPIYRVTVVQRTVEAINYQYRSEPTRIDFRGTVLMPKAKGEALVESKRGRTEIDARLDNMSEPQSFGPEYLTYVLWAVSPEGRPHNIGEVMPNGSNKAKLRITTDMQAFGLIVTAEPYAAVRLPSDVVVAENVVRPDTVGKVEQIQARYDLMPRGHYTWPVPARSGVSIASEPKVSMDQYEAISELYQAQNALGIARAANAEQYAPNTFANAQRLVDEARRLRETNASTRLIVQEAREAAQTAEDARLIAERRRQEESLAKAQAEASAARQARTQADADTQQARSDADAARAQADAERAARQRAESDAAAARERAARAEADAAANRARAADQSIRVQQDQTARQKTELRMRVLEQLHGVISTRDTPRGLVATVPDASFVGPALREAASIQVARVAAIVAASPGLRVEVDGHTDSATTEALSWRRAEVVRGMLVGRGLPASAVTARGLGSAHPLVSNASPGGRVENRRVEIVIS